MAKLISVKGVEGRLAYSAPVGGSVIPVDKAVSLPHSAWIQQRLDVGDIVLAKKPAEIKKTETKE